MRPRHSRQMLFCLGLLLFTLGLIVSSVWAGPLRVIMRDGTSVQVPYYWEEGGQIKFEIAGGIAGIPKAQVESIQEIVASREFNPEVLLEAPRDQAAVTQDKLLQDLVETKVSSREGYEKLDTEESLRLLRMAESNRKDTASRERLHGPLFNIEGEFTEPVRAEGHDVMLLVRHIISSRTDLRGQGFTLVLYDGEGNVLQRKSCELKELDVDQQTLSKLEISGRLYSVAATIRPDSKIKRYEITASSQF